METHKMHESVRGCECGATAETGRVRCVKCSARSRWMRRKSCRPAGDRSDLM